MGKEERQKVIQKFGKLNRRNQALFFDLSRQLYNMLCRNCQNKTGIMGAKIKYELFCDECRIKAKGVEQKMNEVLNR